MDELNHITKHAKNIRLTDAERLAMRESLISYMLDTPVQTPSPFWGVASPLSPFLRQGAFALAILVLVGGGTTLAAEGTLPGDVFYAVKVGVIEPVEGAFQISEDAQVSWQVELASRRLAEIDDLAGTDVLEPAVESAAAARVAKSASAAARQIKAIAQIDTKRAERVALKLDRALSLHGDTLRSLEGAGDASSTPVLRAAADSVGAKARSKAAVMRAPASEAFGASLSVSQDAVMEFEVEDDEDDEEYQRASELFNKARELADQAREREGFEE